jgi:hypothetical protein
VQVLPAYYAQPFERRRVGERDWLYPKGLPGWEARYGPATTGVHTAVCVLEDRHGTVTSAPVSFRCVASRGGGFVRASARDPRFLELSTGEPFFALGQNLAFIGSQQYVTLSRAEAIIGRLGANGANYARIWACCEDWAMAIEARKSAWGRSWDWHPPFVPRPGTSSPARSCVKLEPGRARLEVSPSHPVALRPSTRYSVRGALRAEADARVRLAVHRSPAAALPVPATNAWAAFSLEFTTGENDWWLAGMNFHREGTGAAWLDELSLREAEGGPELLWEADVNRPARGSYNPLDCFMLDELVAAAERHGIYLQLCLLTRDLYMEALKDPGSAEYAQAIMDAGNLLRYAVARWGWSTHVAAWEYWNEMNPGLPTARFYTELGEYLERTDPYRHLRTTSTWGPSPQDCRHPKLDLADVHFYLRPADRGRLENEVEAVLERTRFLREHAPRKPAHLGEFGIANDKWQPTLEMQQRPELVDFHNALWASSLSGASGSALFWWWDRLDPRNVYPAYRPVRDFLAGVPWTLGNLRPFVAQANRPAGLRVVGLRGDSGVWLWVFDPRASWGRAVVAGVAPPEIADAVLELADLPGGRCRATWWDTRLGRAVREDETAVSSGTLRLAVPAFSRDIACRVRW